MQTNLDFKNPLKTICWILSILSWLLFLVTGWMGFFKLAILDYKPVDALNISKYSINNVWSFLNFYFKYKVFALYDEIEVYKKNYFPVQEDRIFYIILFAILMIVGTIGFIIYLFKSVFRKDDHVFEGMMGTFSRYHFIPLACASALFIAGYSHDRTIGGLYLDNFKLFVDDETEEKFLNEFSVDLAFSILGLIILLFVKFQTKIENPFYVVYSIKDGLYSCLVALFTYNVFYSSFYIGLYQKVKKGLSGKDEDIRKFTKDCGIGFSIAIGVINLCVAFGLKDFILPIINFIIYLGLAIHFFDYSEDLRKQDYVTNAEGTIEIVMTVLSAVVFAFLVYLKYKK